MTTIATLADSVESGFIPYYDHFMPNLKVIMKNATNKEFRLLRGKTIECISLMGLAVGQEKVCVCVCVCVRVCVCVYMLTCIYMCTCMYTHTVHARCSGCDGCTGEGSGQPGRDGA